MTETHVFRSLTFYSCPTQKRTQKFLRQVAMEKNIILEHLVCFVFKISRHEPGGRLRLRGRGPLQPARGSPGEERPQARSSGDIQET